MEKNIYYPLDYGWYDSKEKWDHFCSSNCCCFSDCSGKGGFCSSTERREILPKHKDTREFLLQESREVYGGVEVISGDEPRRASPFWRFPAEEGVLQPWRRKLWELKE